MTGLMALPALKALKAQRAPQALKDLKALLLRRALIRNPVVFATVRPATGTSPLTMLIRMPVS